MSAFGFDPEQLFRRRGQRPRVIRQPGRYRRRFIAIGVVVAIIILILIARWLLGLRSDYLFYKSLGHTNVFWDIALRYFGLMLAALALARLAAVYAPNPFRRARR